MNIDLIDKFIPLVVAALVMFVLKPLLTNCADEAVGKRIAEQHPLMMNSTKVLFFVGLAPMIILYARGILPDNDWRGVGIGAGLSILLPFLFMVVYARIARVPLADLYTATREGMPRVVAFAVLSLFAILGIWAGLSLLLEYVFGAVARPVQVTDINGIA